MSTNSPPDPRPTVVDEGGTARVVGQRCTECAYPLAYEALRCPVCRGELAPAQFGPTGTVAASTVLRVRVPGRTPPYAIAYLDLDGGPRVLVHTPGDRALRPGTSARVVGATPLGDIAAQSDEESA